MNAFTAQRLIENGGGSEATTLHEPAEAFDWAALERAMGEDELGPVEYEQLVFALRRILQWVTAENLGKAGRKGLEKLIAARLVGLCWAIDPELFEERPSLRELGLRYKIDRCSIRQQSAKASAVFGLKNREQVKARRTHPKRKPKLPKLTKAQIRNN